MKKIGADESDAAFALTFFLIHFSSEYFFTNSVSFLTFFVIKL